MTHKWNCRIHVESLNATIKIQTNLFYNNPELLSYFTALFYFWMDKLVQFTQLLTDKNYYIFWQSPFPHSEIQTLKRTVSSPPPTALDLGSQNTTNPSSFSSTPNTSSTNPLPVVCNAQNYVNVCHWYTVLIIIIIMSCSLKKSGCLKSLKKFQHIFTFLKVVLQKT